MHADFRSHKSGFRRGLTNHPTGFAEETAKQRKCKVLKSTLTVSLNRSTLVKTLQEIIACFCLVVRHQTHDYSRLCQTFRLIDGETH